MAMRNFLKLRHNEGGGGYDSGELGVYLSIVSSAALSPAIVAANTSAEQEFAFAGVAVGDVVLAIEKPTHQAGLTLVSGRVDSAGNIKIKFGNHTAAGITPTASEIYKATVLRINR